MTNLLPDRDRYMVNIGLKRQTPLEGACVPFDVFRRGAKGGLVESI